MVKITNQHSYAAKILQQSGIQLFAGDTPILTQQYPEEYPIATPKIRLGKSLKSLVKESEKEISHEELLLRGYGIYTRTPISRRPGQRIEYYLSRITPMKKEAARVPQHHAIVFDVNKQRIRLKGANADESWILLRRIRGKYQKEHSPVRVDKIMAQSHDALRRLLPFKIVESPVFQNINGMFIGLTDTAELLVIERTTDPLAIGVVGSRRMGKSILKHSLIDQSFSVDSIPSFEMNDVNRETKSYALPWDEKRHEYFLNLLSYIGVMSRPLPIAYLTPSTKDFNISTHFYPGESSFKISLPYKDILLDHTNFFRGNKAYALDKSEKFVDMLLWTDNGKIIDDGLISARTIPEIRQHINTGLPGKSLYNVRQKLFHIMRWQYNLGYFDISSDAPSMWKVVLPDGSTKEYHPWNACLVSGICCSMVTSELRRQVFHTPYLSFIANSVFNLMKNDPLMENREVLLVCDEFQGLLSDTRATEVFDRIIRESGMNRIGFLWVTQDPGEVPDGIRINTGYTFAFRLDDQEARRLAKDYEVNPNDSRIKDIKRLKRFQCVAFTKSHFVLYDVETGKRRITDEPMKIVQIFPPLSRHIPPREVGIM